MKDNLWDSKNTILSHELKEVSSVPTTASEPWALGVTQPCRALCTLFNNVLCLVFFQKFILNLITHELQFLLQYAPGCGASNWYLAVDF